MSTARRIKMKEDEVKIRLIKEVCTDFQQFMADKKVLIEDKEIIFDKYHVELYVMKTFGFNILVIKNIKVK
jgi:hypothetical protein